ncbi:hypothetical protein N7539_003476 [Penicillium diatomitis]|uniref:Uncharacterized protein n=1 Tax=Penicillium diatomitis TaxID=2819901 RepID=A0A9W9XC43_9EURO|nr:uncharacterized protein N7539_003476 [Penicillium diatomitis]KAJ5488586.1 hypothetical protein N7539_003476 [Penicillium diatomitis]
MSRFRIPLASASRLNSLGGVSQTRPLYWDSTRVNSVQRYQDISETLSFITLELEKWQQQTSDFLRGITVYLFTDVRREWGNALFQAIDERFRVRKTWDSQARTLSLKMPTQGHDIAQKWVINSVVDWKDDGIISKEEWRGLKIGFGTTLKLPMSPFPKFQKEPDIYIRPYDSDSEFLPPIAFEIGWSENASRLKDDVRILLEGGGGHIRVVIVIDWYLQKDGLTVTGKVDLWRRGLDGHPIHEQSEDIYPVPRLLRGQGQRLGVTLDDIFLTTLRANQDPKTIVYFDIGQLREEADKARWFETTSRLKDDVRILLEGGGRHIRIGIIINWYL